MKQLYTLIAFLLLINTHSFCQLSLNGSSNYLINFDASVSGVNSGNYTGSGFANSPSSGQLDADAWATTGLSDGSKNFGTSNTSGDHARGSSNGGVSSGGFYGFDIGGGNRAMGFQPTGGDWTPGTITLKIVNNTSSVIDDMTIGYTVYVRNDQSRGSSFNFSYSSNNSNYTNVSSANYTSPQSGGSTTWVPNNRSIQLSNLNIAVGASFYIRWSSSDVSGSGSRDEFALDDISIAASGSSNNCVEPSAQAFNLNFGSVTSSSIQGSFSTSSADKFLVVQSTSSSLGAVPTDGVTYFAGNNLGSGEVLQYSSSSSFSSSGLNPNTNYYFHVFAANDNCTGGPDYRTNNPLFGSVTTSSNGGSNYYSSIGNQTCASLKTELSNLIDGHTSVSYGSLWTHYQTTDDHLNDAGNQTIVWDIYSDNPTGSENEFTFVSEQCGTYQTEGDCYNREHTFPKSWWGGSTSADQYTDLFAVLPADGWINGIRSNNPYGEIQPGTESHITNNGTALGSSSVSIPGYSGSVFEPIDAYKGDLARGYFYMATRYENSIAGWETTTTESDAVLDGTSYPVYEQWMINMLISWHNLDPVDQKEIDRNEAVFLIQGNRNPFIDHPEYAGLIWSNCGGGGDTQAPTAPTSLSANNTTQTSTNLSWNSSSDNVGVTGYYIYQNGSLIAVSSNTSSAVSGLSAGTSYSFYVRAYDAAGNVSSSSNSINVTTATAQDTQAPTTPSSLSASNTTETSTSLSWNASSDNVGVVGYYVYQNGSLIATTANTSSTVSGLSAGTSYSFYVRAYDAAGNVSSNSNSINVTTNSSSSNPTVLHEGYFESGWDGWQDGGSDCARYSNSYSAEGNYSIRIRDNSGTSSSMTSPVFNISSYSQIDVSFSYYPKGMDSNEDFWLRYYNGSSWQTIAVFRRDVDFVNNNFYSAVVTIDNNSVNFPSNAQFRFQNDASVNNDQVFIDEVVIVADDFTGSLLPLIAEDHYVQTEAMLNEQSDTKIIEEIQQNSDATDRSKISVYPNPAQAFINVDLSKFDSKVLSLEVLNMMGQPVQSIQVNAANKVIQHDVSTLTKGIYYIKAIDNQNSLETVRFIIQ